MIHYRIASINDLEGLYSVMVDTTFIHFKYGDVSKDVAIKHLKKDFFSSGWFSRPPTVIVGELDGEIICYSMFGSYKKYSEKDYPKERKNYAYSRGTGVFKKLRGKGVGGQLRLKADEFAKHFGYVGMYTSVNVTNKSSLKVQQKADFQEVQRIHKSGRTDILFKKDF